MIHMPSTPRSFLDMLGISIRHHFVVLQRTFLLVIMMVIVKDWYIYLGGFPTNPILAYLVGILMTFLLIYLFVTMLYMANRVLHNETVTLRGAFLAVNKRILPLVSASLIFIIAPLILVLVSESILHFITHSGGEHYKYDGLIFVLVVGIPIMIAYLKYFFTIPLIVMEDFPIWCAFHEAGELVYKEWLRVFGVYACAIAIWLLVSPDTLHGHLMRVYHISAVFDFIVFCVTLPIMMNLIVFMRNDLRLRKSIEET